MTSLLFKQTAKEILKHQGYGERDLIHFDDVEDIVANLIDTAFCYLYLNTEYRRGSIGFADDFKEMVKKAMDNNK